MYFTEKEPAFILTKCCPVWPYIESVNEFLITIRKGTKRGEVRSGINYTIILNTACCVEGILEYILKELLFHKNSTLPKSESKDFYKYYYSIEKEIHDRITKTTGIDNYNYLFKLLTGREVKKIDVLKPHIEGVNVLFELRNVLAHGREIKFESFCIDIANKEYYDSFMGGYKKAEDYLIKKGIIKKRFADCKNDIFFTNNVANYFWKLSHNFINDIIKSLDVDFEEIVQSNYGEQSPVQERSAIN